MFLSWFFLFFFQNLWFNIPMMNDMMPTIEEIATPDILAQIEHEEWERGNEERERWEAVEAAHVVDRGRRAVTHVERYRYAIEEQRAVGKRTQ